MQEKSLESISAMMDGEVEEFELRRLIARTSSEQELRAKWQRYHLAQDVIKGQPVQVGTNLDFVAGVSAALAAEPSFGASVIADLSTDKENVADKREWWKPVASMAVAASVTAVVLLGSGLSFQDPTGVPVAEMASASLLNSGFSKSRFGSELATVSAGHQSGQAPKATLDMGLYIQQHIDLVSPKAAAWQANWMLSDYKKIDHKVTAKAEVLLFSNGVDSLSINIEPLNSQATPQGVVVADDLIALGVRSHQQFITVVGALSPQQAAKIATSVGPKSK